LELFTTFDRHGNAAGVWPRDVVHERGLWHKSAQVFVFDAAARLLVQRRAAHKDLYAELWDYSVGEHLQPGETFQQGALRGLREELGIEQAELVPLGSERYTEIVTDDHADREIQQAFRCTYAGEVRLDPLEVDEVRYIDIDDLRGWLEDAPQQFTPWFIEDVRHFGIV
jgi:isopentenyldiphosphate isomerase